MKHLRLAGIALLALTLGCGGSSVSATTTSRTAQPVASFIEVRVFQRDGVEERTVQPGAVMQSGDRFYLSVRAGEPVYLYLMYVGPDGRAHVLYPPEGEGDFRLEAGREIRFPPDSAMELDDVTGTEHLYVIASRDPIETLNDDTLASYRAAKAGQPLPEAPASEPSPRTSMGGSGAHTTLALGDLAVVRTRGLTVVPDDAADTHLEASPDDQGVAVVFFPIDHR